MAGVDLTLFRAFDTLSHMKLLLQDQHQLKLSAPLALQAHRTFLPRPSLKAAFFCLALMFCGTLLPAADTCGRCYSIAYVFGHKLQSELLVPVGVMNAAVAGTGIEGWWYVAPGDPPTPTSSSPPRMSPYPWQCATRTPSIRSDATSTTRMVCRYRPSARAGIERADGDSSGWAYCLD